MRAISGSAAAVLSGASVPMVLLVEMLLSQPLRMSSSTRTITYGGHDYLGLGHLGGAEPIDDSAGENKSMRFVLNGVSTDLLAVSLAEQIRGKPTTMRLAVLDPDTHEVLDDPIIWSGSLDQMPVTVGKETSTISVTAEHRGSTYSRPKTLKYNDTDQQRLFPGDTSHRFLASQSHHRDIWPAADFLRK